MSPNYIRLANFLNLSLKSEPSVITFFSDLVDAIGLDALPLCSFISFFLAPKDLSFYVDQISSSGFRGGLNWYRNINRLPAITAPFLGSTINQPSFYMGGSTDLIAGNTPEAISSMQQALGDLRHCEIIEGAGHWLQQERPLEVNKALLNFINSLN